MEPLQVLSPFCKVWIITFENLREKESFINEVEWNALYCIMTIRVLFFQSHSGMATEPRLGYCCLVSSSNAGNHGRQKKIIIFLMLMILVWVPNLKSKSRNDLEVSIFLITAFNQISFFQISWQMHIFPCWNLTFHSLHILCSDSLFTFLLSQCKWNNCKLQFWGGQIGCFFFFYQVPPEELENNVDWIFLFPLCFSFLIWQVLSNLFSCFVLKTRKPYVITEILFYIFSNFSLYSYKSSNL